MIIIYVVLSQALECFFFVFTWIKNEIWWFTIAFYCFYGLTHTFFFLNFYVFCSVVYFCLCKNKEKKNYQNITNSGNGFVLTVDTRPPSQTDEHTVNTLKID